MAVVSQDLWMTSTNRTQIPPPDAHVSPDGRFWWNGYTWVGVRRPIWFTLLRVFLIAEGGLAAFAGIGVGLLLWFAALWAQSDSGASAPAGFVTATLAAVVLIGGSGVLTIVGLKYLRRTNALWVGLGLQMVIVVGVLVSYALLGLVASASS